jgi:hypothetical protein
VLKNVDIEDVISEGWLESFGIEDRVLLKLILMRWTLNPSRKV